MSTHLPVAGGHPEGFGATVRSDRWWPGPLATLVILSGFIVYATWAAFQGAHYYAGPYLSPFYSPVLFTANPDVLGNAPLDHAWLGLWPSWWPDFLPASPAFLILMFPGMFRFTCYYYRKAYYRGFAGSPPACAVVPLAKGKKRYKGEMGLFIFQNLHRYALLFALAFVPILYYDAFLALSHNGEFGFGVGTLVLFINATLLAMYTFGCHSFRHLIGGKHDCMSCGKRTMRYKSWLKVTWLNERHMAFAWTSLFWVAFTDLYVRLVSMRVITDFNTWN